MVGVVGPDFPRDVLDELQRRGIDLAGVEERPGTTFRWTGRYHEDVNVRDTLHLDLGVFGDFRPTLPESYRDSRYVFLANIDPVLQASVLEQLRAPALVGCDTMNHWIAESRPALEQLLARVDMLVINDEEARLLSGERNIVRARAPHPRRWARSTLLDQARRVRRHSVRRRVGVRRAGLPARRGVRSDRRRRLLRRRLHGRAGALAATSRRPACAAPSSTAASWRSFVVEDFGPRRLLALDARGHRAALPAVREPDGDRVR